MDPPYAQTIDKKLGTIYFTGFVNIFKPCAFKDRTSFSLKDAETYQKKCLKGKNDAKAKMTALDESLVFKKKSKLGKRLPHKQIKYSFLETFYDFSESNNLIILAVATPKKPIHYLALNIEDASKTRTFVQILKYAAVAPNKNLKNPIPRPSLTQQQISTEIEKANLQTPQLEVDSKSLKELSANGQPPSVSRSPNTSSRVSRRSISSSDLKLSKDSLSFSASSTSSTSSLSLASLSNSRQDLLKNEDNHTDQSETYASMEKLNQQSRQPIIQTSSASHIAKSPGSSFCEKCRERSKNVVNIATSPILFKNMIYPKQLSRANSNSEIKQSRYQPITPSGNNNNNTLNPSKRIPIVVVKNGASRSSSSSSSSSSSISQVKFKGQKFDTLPKKDDDVYILASGKFQPFSYISNERSRSSCDICSICGKVGEGESRTLDIIKTDKNGLASLSNEGTVFMYSKTESVDSKKNIFQEKVISESIFEKASSSKRYREGSFSSENSTSSSDSSFGERGITFLR